MSQASKWVMQRIKHFIRFLGVSFEGFEEDAMFMFSKIGCEPQNKPHKLRMRTTKQTPLSTPKGCGY
jgi:hypothetical protein